MTISKMRPLFSRLRKEAIKKKLSLGEKGQSLVEFVLLLTMVMIISLAFLKLVNGKVADYWLAMGNMLTEDPSIQLELK